MGVRSPTFGAAFYPEPGNSRRVGGPRGPSKEGRKELLRFFKPSKAVSSPSLCSERWYSSSTGSPRRAVGAGSGCPRPQKPQGRCAGGAAALPRSRAGHRGNAVIPGAAAAPDGRLPGIFLGSAGLCGERGCLGGRERLPLCWAAPAVLGGPWAPGAGGSGSGSVWPGRSALREERPGPAVAVRSLRGLGAGLNWARRKRADGEYLKHFRTPSGKLF